MTPTVFMFGADEIHDGPENKLERRNLPKLWGGLYARRSGTGFLPVTPELRLEAAATPNRRA